MKKHSLFKFMGILILIVLCVSYAFPSRSGEVSYLPLGDILTNYQQSYYYFWDTALFVLVIGAFYGVLNKTGAYKKLLDNIVLRAKPAGKKFVFAIAILFAVVAAMTGMQLQLIVFIPFVISIILLLGYDKLVAISSTVVSTLIGFMGGVFVTFRDPNNYYSTTFTTFEKFVGVDSFSNLIPQIILLVIGVVLLCLFMDRHIKSVKAKKVKYELNGENDVLVTEVKGNYKDIKTWPLITIFAFCFVLIVLGLVPWNHLSENIVLFDEFHTWINEIHIKDFYIFKNVISGSFPAFGRWAETLGNYMMINIILLIATLLIKFIYKIKFNDLFDNIAEGAKKMLPTAALMMLAYCILICTYNNGFVENLITKVSDGGDINFVVATFISLFGSLLHVDVYYTVAGVFSPILAVVTNEELFGVFGLLFQSIYGLVAIFAPTSLILIFALSYLDVPYTTWLKYIWRFILSLFIVIFAVLLIMTLI